MGGFKRGGNLRADHLADVAAELADLAHQRAADALHACIGQDKNRFDFRSELAVHRGHLRFVVEVGEVANTAHDYCGLVRGAEVDDEPVEGQHAYAPHRYRGFANLINALRKTEHGFFVMRSGHGNDDPVEQAGSAAHHVAVAQRERVKGAGIDGNAWCGRLGGRHWGIMPLGA